MGATGSHGGHAAAPSIGTRAPARRPHADGHDRGPVGDREPAGDDPLRTARYDDDREEVDFGEISAFIAPRFVITVRQGVASELHSARTNLEAHPQLLAEGSPAVLWAILDQVIKSYGPVVAELERDIEEVESTVFAGEAAPTERIYFLRREVTNFHRAVHPLLTVLVLLLILLAFAALLVRAQHMLFGPPPADVAREEQGGLRVALLGVPVLLLAWVGLALPEPMRLLLNSAAAVVPSAMPAPADVTGPDNSTRGARYIRSRCVNGFHSIAASTFAGRACSGITIGLANVSRVRSDVRPARRSPWSAASGASASPIP